MQFNTNVKLKIVGTFFFIAVAQFILCLIIAEAVYPNYNISDNYISDLGVGSSAIIFNCSVFLLGLLLIFGEFFLKQISDFNLLNILITLMAIGAMGVGIFTEHFGAIHYVFASMAFLFGGLSAIVSVRVLKMPLSLISIVLGTLTIGALVLFLFGFVTSGSLNSNYAVDSIFFLGLGPGGMERMIAYPALLWLAAYSGHLLTRQENQPISHD